MHHHETREQWLNAAIAHLRPFYASQGYPLPDKLRVTCGFTSHRATNGTKNQSIGQCWDARASADGTIEIIVSITQAEPVRAIDILAHELCHAAAGLECGHKGAFRTLATAIGLEGKMVATKAGPEFIKRAESIMEALGPYPHAALDARNNGKKKQTTRLLKAACESCGYTVRISKKWYDELGACCPDHGPMEIDEGTGE